MAPSTASPRASVAPAAHRASVTEDEDAPLLRDNHSSHSPPASPQDEEAAATGTRFMEDQALFGVVVPEADGSRWKWRTLLAYVGPGFLVAIAYIDPGNFESDLQAGAQYKYQLLWVLCWATLAGLLIQALAANLGIVTGHHLAQHCRSEYPPVLNFFLWIMAEIAIIASDVPEVLGTAFALQMLFKLPLWLGVLLTSLDTLLLLGMQTIKVRRLEAIIASMVFIIAACFLAEVGFAQPSIPEVLAGTAIPRIADGRAGLLAISLVGAVVMPHNLYLHSALVLSRDVPRSKVAVKEAIRYNLIECTIALLLSFIINTSVVSVSGAVCFDPDITAESAAKCAQLDLHNTPFLLRDTLGQHAEKIFAIALLASGQSSTMTGTYAGQYVMSGFLDLKITPWLRNLVTRSVAIVPSLVIAIVAGDHGAGELIIISSMILCIQLPYALLPLLKFTSSEKKMGPFKSTSLVTGASFLIAAIVLLSNTFFLLSSFVFWQSQTTFSPALQALLTVAAAVGVIAYLASVCYLACRKTRTNTYTTISGCEAEKGEHSLANFSSP
eukprot:jgi/Chlat1/2094/Chrsp17S02693